MTSNTWVTGLKIVFADHKGDCSAIDDKLLSAYAYGRITGRRDSTIQNWTVFGSGLATQQLVF